MQEIYVISVKKNVNIYVKNMCKDEVTGGRVRGHEKKKAFDLSDQKLFRVAGVGFEPTTFGL